MTSPIIMTQSTRITPIVPSPGNTESERQVRPEKHDLHEHHPGPLIPSSLPLSLTLRLPRQPIHTRHAQANRLRLPLRPLNTLLLLGLLGLLLLLLSDGLLLGHLLGLLLHDGLTLLLHMLNLLGREMDGSGCSHAHAGALCLCLGLCLGVGVCLCLGLGLRLRLCLSRHGRSHGRLARLLHRARRHLAAVLLLELADQLGVALLHHDLLGLVQDPLRAGDEVDRRVGGAVRRHGPRWLRVRRLRVRAALSLSLSLGLGVGLGLQVGHLLLDLPLELLLVGVLLELLLVGRVAVHGGVLGISMGEVLDGGGGHLVVGGAVQLLLVVLLLLLVQGMLLLLANHHGMLVLLRN